MAFPSAGWFLIGSRWRQFFSLFYHPDEKAVLWLLRLWHLRLLGRSAPNIYDEEATVSIVTGFLLCFFILMDVPSPWVRSCEYVFFSLFHYKSSTLSRVILGVCFLLFFHLYDHLGTVFSMPRTRYMVSNYTLAITGVSRRPRTRFLIFLFLSFSS